VTLHKSCSNSHQYKLLSSQTGTRADNSRGTTLIPANNRLSVKYDQNNLWLIPAPVVTVGDPGFLTCDVLLSGCSSGGIFRLLSWPGSHHPRARWQADSGVLVSINACFFYWIYVRIMPYAQTWVNDPAYTQSQTDSEGPDRRDLSKSEGSV